MSPTKLSAPPWTPRFPRVSGDEPFLVSATTETFTFSPRERG